MAIRRTLAERWTRAMNRLAAWRAGLCRPVAALAGRPEPRSIGSPFRGRQLMTGDFVLAGHLVQAPDTTPWRIAPPDAGFAAALHGFAWLDDLAALGDGAARARAQRWTGDWIVRYGRGRGPGWAPDLTGRRLLRWISHAQFLLHGQDSAAASRLMRSLARQTAFLARRQQAAPPGLPRFEALTGLIIAALSLQGMAAHIAPARRALSRDCDRCIDAGGALPGRNPEELLEVMTLLTWAATALSEAGHTADPAHWGAIERIAPTLRSLRHADGGLARFHGGGRGLDGRLDAALAASGVKARRGAGLAMGFARLGAGRTSVIVDAAPPPKGPASAAAHASTLAFELTSGRRPLIVSCGAGHSFGPEWRRAGRATPSHSALVLAGLSSARLGRAGAERDRLSHVPRRVPVETRRTPGGLRLEAAHDGYLRGHGLTHVRRLDLSDDGRSVMGEDMLLALEPAHKRRFDAALDAAAPRGIGFDIRFHLHPEVAPAHDPGGGSVSLRLPGGEVWLFRAAGPADLSLQASVYLEKTRDKPRATRQIVLSGRATAHATRVTWSLAKAPDTPFALRDLEALETDPAASPARNRTAARTRG